MYVSQLLQLQAVRVRACARECAGGSLNFSKEREREKKSSCDVSNTLIQFSKMAEVSGLRSRNHFESNCKSRVVDEGKLLLLFRVDV